LTVVDEAFKPSSSSFTVLPMEPKRVAVIRLE
jgi:hypothetical protein